MSTMSASDAAPLPRLGEVFFDVRGSSRSMRLSWYADTGVSVFSIWQGGTCTGTFRLPMEELPRLIDALQRGMPGADQQDALRAKCVEMRDFVVKIRSHTAMEFAAPVVKGLPPGSQPLLDWKLREFASHRRDSDPADLRNDTDPPPVVPEIPPYPGLHREAAPRWAALSAKARADDSDLVVPAAERSRYQAAFARFASVFPDTFYVQERGRYFPDDSEDKGRLLSAGLITGKARMDLIRSLLG